MIKTNADNLFTHLRDEICLEMFYPPNENKYTASNVSITKFDMPGYWNLENE